MQTEYYKNLLLDNQTELKRRLAAIEVDVRSEASKDSEEQSIERENDEVIDTLGNSAREELGKISQALRRIDSGNYFDCIVCGEPIGEARLTSVPYTDICVECAEEEEFIQKGNT